MTHRWHKYNLTKFQTRTLGLNANRKWFEISDDKACQMCADRNSIENEVHFVFDCPAYTDIRNGCDLFNKPAAQRKDIKAILSYGNEQDISKFAKYIAEASDFRKKNIVI